MKKKERVIILFKKKGSLSKKEIRTAILKVNKKK
jgi:hypothetical protein